MDSMRHQLRATGLATLAAILAVLVVASSADAKGGSRFFGLDYTFDALHDEDVSKLNKSGAKTVRWTFYWPRLEGPEGNFKWAAADKVVGALASRGIQVLPTVFGSPKWVAKSAITPPISSEHARNAWKEFLRQAVKRYGPQGTYWTTQYSSQHPGRPPRPIKLWQIWNEPNLKTHFSPRPSPRRYARLLKLSHRAISDADPGAKVMFAGMPGYSNDINAWGFLERVYRQPGARHAFDVTALHPYARNVRQMLGEVKRFRKVMSKHGDRRKGLWITEVGWGSAHKTRFGLTKGKRGQARILKRSFRALKRKRHQWQITRVLWFNFRDPKGGTRGCSFCSSAGLLRNNSRPKPAWRAFRSFTN
jgi:hypothetical protein